MSYASVAAHNAPPPLAQPYREPALLTMELPSQGNIADDAANLNIVFNEFRETPTTLTSTADTGIREQSAPIPISGGVAAHGTSGAGTSNENSKGKEAVDKAKRYAHELEDEGFYLWNLVKHQLLRPGVAGVLPALVNVGILGFTSYSRYMKPYLRRDTRLLSSAAAAALALLSADDYNAEKYCEAPAGQEEKGCARKEGAVVYRVARDNLLRPDVLGVLVGLLNTAVIFTSGFVSHKHRDARQWDRRIISAVSVGLLMLCFGEGYLAEYYGREQGRRSGRVRSLKRFRTRSGKYRYWTYR
ncbi:hypothetical protein BC629DRAFT_1505245 [Irpex lacteus]|nr:hypothetical protein BC629DRAFT_1505245 [Irpex lacteus]